MAASLLRGTKPAHDSHLSYRVSLNMKITPGTEGSGLLNKHSTNCPPSHYTLLRAQTLDITNTTLQILNLTKIVI